MKTLSKLVAATAIIFATGAIAPVNAACLNSVWQKSSGDSLAHTIKGRQCGANMSVKFIGVVNTGWIAMQKASFNNLRATFVDNNVTTHIDLKPQGTKMNTFFTHVANDGATSTTTGSYTLLSMQ